MRENGVKRIWREGGAVINGWLHVPSSFSAEVMAHAGWDSLTIDMQHGAADYGDVLGMLQAISTTETIPIVRAPWNDPGLVMRLLDAGAYGIICPLVNTREDAERFVGACRYPSPGNPLGYRSYGPYRATLYGGSDYPEHADDAVIAMPMIETVQAMQNLDDILSVPGLDAVFVGPSDLGQSMGIGPGLDREEPGILDVFDEVLAAARARDVPVGVFTGSAGYAARMIEKGFRFVTVSTDARLMAAGAANILSSLRG